MRHKKMQHELWQWPGHEQKHERRGKEHQSVVSSTTTVVHSTVRARMAIYLWYGARGNRSDVNPHRAV